MFVSYWRCIAQVAELVDAYASGAYGSNPVEVQVLSWALECKDGTHLLYHTVESCLCVPASAVEFGRLIPLTVFGNNSGGDES